MGYRGFLFFVFFCVRDEFCGMQPSMKLWTYCRIRNWSNTNSRNPYILTGIVSSYCFALFFRAKIQCNRFHFLSISWHIQLQTWFRIFNSFGILFSDVKSLQKFPSSELNLDNSFCNLAAVRWMTIQIVYFYLFLIVMAADDKRRTLGLVRSMSQY